MIRTDIMPTISIIVPVYNSSRFLPQCLDSIVAQTYGDFEVVVIDDGSSDGTGKICDEYCSFDSRFSVYHIENHGVSYARNLGVEKSKAELITFVDSDDSVMPDYCEVILREMGDNDLLVFQAEFCSASGKQVIVQKTGQFNGQSEVEEGLFSIHSKCDQVGYPWNKVFRRKIIKENGIFFPSNVSWKEDEVFVLRYVRCISSMKIIPNVIYIYNVNECGLTHSAVSSNGLDIVADLIRQEIRWIHNRDLKGSFIRLIFRCYNHAAVLEKNLSGKIKLFKKARFYYHTNKECMQLDGKFDRLMYSLPYVAGLVCFLLFGREL